VQAWSCWGRGSRLSTTIKENIVSYLWVAAVRFSGAFILLATLAMTAWAGGIKCGTEPPDPQIRLSLAVNRVAANEKSGKPAEQFVLTIENTGDEDCPIPPSASELWSIRLYRENMPDETGLRWQPSRSEAPLKPGKTYTVAAEWQFPDDFQPGTYHFEAEFVPSFSSTKCVKKTADFTIWPTTERKIFFTGRLMGYYRLPNEQPFAGPPSGCPPTPSPDDLSPDAWVFAHNYFADNFKDRLRDAVLVGTGDNFSPNYYSRVFTKEPPQWPKGKWPNKELWDWDGKKWVWYEDVENGSALRAQLQSGTSSIPTDNVACFLAYAHYDAVVPGKHDFYYGPERLRQLAHFMARIPADGNFKPVQMLGANMMIKTNWAKDHLPVPDSDKRPLPFLTKYSQIPNAKFSPPKAASPTSTPPPTHNGKDTFDKYQNVEIQDFSDGGFAFPWMQFVRVDAQGWEAEAVKASLQVYLCEALPGDPDDFLGHGGFCNKERLLSMNVRATQAAAEDGPPKTVHLVYDLPGVALLSPGTNYAICIPASEVTVDKRTVKNADDAKPYCFQFSVYNPFFQFPVGDGKSASLPQHYENPKLYVLKEEAGKTPVVIFGVVDPALQEHVGGENFAWRTVRGVPGWGSRDTRYTTSLTVADPVQTLIHLEDYFEKQYSDEHPGQDFQGIRVLLAQMPLEEVKQLADHLPKCLRFDVIVAAADDGLATPNQTVQFRPSSVDDSRVCHTGVGSSGLKMASEDLANGALSAANTFIAVPPTHEEKPALPLRYKANVTEQKSRFLQVRELQVTSEPYVGSTYTLAGDPYQVPIPETTTPPKKKTLEEVANSFWHKVCVSVYEGNTKPCSPGTKPNPSGGNGEPDKWSWDEDAKKPAIQQLVLGSIREHHHADVALLQERDFYYQGLNDYLAEHSDALVKDCSTLLPCHPAIDTQEIFDRIVWKGDYLEVISVKGSVLKNVLKQSNNFTKLEKTAYLSVSEAGRPLVTLGIDKDLKNGGDYLINGRPLDPNALYTVATSDYIALGDTGYADLATPPVGDPSPATSASEQIVTISGSACNTLKSSDCHDSLPRKGYYDELANRAPDDRRKGDTDWHKFYAWTFLHKDLGQPYTEHRPQEPPGADDIRNEMSKRVGVERKWDFSADKLSIGFTALTHSDSEQALSGKFGGVQNSQVNAKHTHSWEWDANTKLTIYHPKNDYFLSEGLQYSSSFTANLSGPLTETQSRNQFAVDAGTYLHPWYKDKQLPQVSAVLSEHFETQAGNPITNVNLSPVPPSTSSSTLSFFQGRTKLLLGRAGARFQDRKSFAEAGLEGGQTLNSIEEFLVTTSVGGPVVPCFLKASISLTKCLNTFNKNNPLTPVTPDSKVRVLRSPQPRYGVYWNMGLTVPIKATISYNFQEASDYFFLSSGDNSADTRFRHQLIHTLKFTVFPNLSFEPTYTIFLYENKLDYNFLLQQQYSVKINYSFDWSNWHESKQQLRYKKTGTQ
jgi:5'-nucleotidase, C-terminal domain